MARVKILVVERDTVELLDHEEISGQSDLISSAGLTNLLGDITLEHQTGTESIQTIRSELDYLDKNKDNSVAGFNQTTMNNLSLYNTIQEITGGGTPGPAVYPINMGRNASGSQTIDYYAGVRSNQVPAILPFPAQTMAISFASQALCQFRLRLYKNTSLPGTFNATTLVYTLETSGANVRFLRNTTINLSFNAGDMLTFMVTQLAGNVQNPGASLWLRSTS